MTHRGVVFCAAAALCVMASTAFAQDDRVVVPSKRRPPPFAVSSFAPQSGPVNTLVTIQGSGFYRDTQVFFGGEAVYLVFASDSQLQFNVPARFRDGQIVVRQPGVGDVVAGSFAVLENPFVSGFAPPSGPPGTRVEIRGNGFSPQDQVFFNGRAIPTEELGAHRIVVVIPRGSRSGPFTVARPNGPQAVSAQAFNVSVPVPVVQAISPNAGPPGTQVRISGYDFDPADQVMYGQWPAQVTGRTDRTIDVVVPPRARRGESFVLHGPNHPDVASAPFNLMSNPVIASFAPTSGAAGTRVEIFGSGFRPGDQVMISGRPLSILGMEEGRVVVAIAPDAQDDVFTIVRGGQVVASSRDTFNVIEVPTVEGFAPPSGPPGTEVSIEVHHLGRGDVRVFYGRIPVPILNRDHGRITVAVPREARGSEPFVIQARGGEVRTGQAFQIMMPVSIDSIEPSSGPAGTRVRIKGRFEGLTPRFYLSGVELPVERTWRDGAVVTIPGGVRSGDIEVEIYGTRQPTRFHFDVLQPMPPRIVEMRPTIGPPGTQVIIFGENLPPNPSVTWGRVPVQVISTAPDQMTVVIPNNAPQGFEPFVVADGLGNRVVTPDRFQVVARGRGY